MKLNYACPYWGSDRYSPSEFIEKVLESGYQGIEVFLQPDDAFSSEFVKCIHETQKNNPDFFFIALQLTVPVKESVDSYIRKMEKSLTHLVEVNPLFINSHAGKDYYSFDENCRVIEHAMNISEKTGVRILHETHRGRFSFHAASLLPYLNKFHEMELVGDFSHFCTVSESMLEDQEEIINQIIPFVSHIHARVGFEQAPQVNNPAAPEWNKHLNQFIEWWQAIVNSNKDRGNDSFTISPEFGPEPYMPVQPFSQIPLSNQWDNNMYMMNILKQKLLV